MVADALRWNMNAGWNEVVPCPFPYLLIIGCYNDVFL